ncbi:MAG: hypothetical protein ACK5V7_14415 [bacterium]|jgi:hypothetical protein
MYETDTPLSFRPSVKLELALKKTQSELDLDLRRWRVAELGCWNASVPCGALTGHG